LPHFHYVTKQAKGANSFSAKKTDRKETANETLSVADNGAGILNAVQQKRYKLDRYRTFLIDYEQRTLLEYHILNQNQRFYLVA
jgi:hypothetical protein